MRHTHIQLDDRNGITLMEVLIAIGILAVGLSSVAALLPAAGSQAKKAVIADRAASMAENCLADAVTIGVIKPRSLALLGSGGPVSLPSSTSTYCNWNRIVIDPLGDPGLSEDLNNDLNLNPNEDDGANDDADGYLDGLIYAGLELDGIFSGGGAASNDVLKLFSQGRDDLVYNEPVSDDALPTNAFFEGTRGFLGRTSCVWMLESLDGNPVAAVNFARLSVVLFHERDQSSATASVFNGGGTAVIDGSGRITWTGSLPEGKTIKQLFKPGTVVVRHNPLNNLAPAAYVLRAAPGSPNGGVYAIADDERLRQFPGGASDSVSILVGSVGLAQKIVTLEGNSEYTSSDQRKVTPCFLNV